MSPHVCLVLVASTGLPNFLVFPEKSATWGKTSPVAVLQTHYRADFRLGPGSLALTSREGRYTGGLEALQLRLGEVIWEMSVT